MLARSKKAYQLTLINKRIIAAIVAFVLTAAPGPIQSHELAPNSKFDEKKETLNDGILPLGQDADVSKIGNKARSFVAFQTLGLPYPRGFVISASTIRAIMNDDTAVPAEISNRIVELFGFEPNELRQRHEGSSDTATAYDSRIARLRRLKYEMERAESIVSHSNRMLENPHASLPSWLDTCHREDGVIVAPPEDLVNEEIAEITSTARRNLEEYEPRYKKLQVEVEALEKSLVGDITTRLQELEREIKDIEARMRPLIKNPPVPHEATDSLYYKLEKQLRDYKKEHALLFDKLREVKMVLRPLLSVRSSPVFSLPGCYITITDISDLKKLKDDIKSVANSYNSEKARNMRRNLGVPEESGMAVIVQRMVYGDLDDNSGSGCVFSRNPNTGEKGFFGTFAVKRKGEYIVSGNSSDNGLEALKERFPEAYKGLEEGMMELEKHLRCPQEVEFVIEDGMLYFLQIRDMRFGLQGEIRYLQDAGEEGLLSRLMVVPRLEALQERIKQRRVYKIKEGIKRNVLLKGQASTPGAMAGRVVFSIEKAEELSGKGERVILALEERPNRAMAFIDRIFKIPAIGLVLSYGNSSSHEAVLMRLAGIPSIMGVPSGVNIHPFLRSIFVPGASVREVREGNFIVIDGNKNEVFLTDDKEVLVEDAAVMDASFGIDINGYRRKFARPYLTEDGRSIRPEVSYEQLLRENVEAWKRYKALPEGSDKKAAFIANLEKHFLHELLLQKAQEAGKTKGEANQEIDQLISNESMQVASQEQESPEAGEGAKGPAGDSIAIPAEVDEFKNLLRKRRIFTEEQIDILMRLETPGVGRRCMQFEGYVELTQTMGAIDCDWSHMAENYIDRLIRIFGAEVVLNRFWDDPYKFLITIISHYKFYQNTRDISDATMEENFRDFMNGTVAMSQHQGKRRWKAEPLMEESIKAHLHGYVEYIQRVLEHTHGSTKAHLNENAVSFIERYTGIILPKNITIGSFILRMLYGTSKEIRVLATNGNVYRLGCDYGDSSSYSVKEGQIYIYSFSESHDGGHWDYRYAGEVAEYFYDPAKTDEPQVKPPPVQELLSSVASKEKSLVRVSYEGPCVAVRTDVDTWRDISEQGMQQCICELEKIAADGKRGIGLKLEEPVYEYVKRHMGIRLPQTLTIEDFLSALKKGPNQSYGCVLGTDGKIRVIGGFCRDDTYYLEGNRIVHFMDNHEGGNTYNHGTVKEYYYNENEGEGFVSRVLAKHNLKDISLVFDIDGTLNKERNKPIEEKIASQLADLRERGVDIQIVTGKSKKELGKYGVFKPLIDLLSQRGRSDLMEGMVIYTSDGAGRYVFSKEGVLVLDREYSQPFSEEEAKAIEEVAREISDELDRAYGLRERGIEPFRENFENLKYNFSPYGNVDKSEYDFEKNPEVASKYSPPRKTRKELGEEAIRRLKERGVHNIVYSTSGNTTIGFVRQGVNKRKACEHILSTRKTVIFVGDEVGGGEDGLVAMLAKDRLGLLVISVDENRPVELHERAIWIGGKVSGTWRFLSRILVAAAGILKSREMARSL